MQYWKKQICPFVNTSCTKFNHDQTVVYGVCSVVNRSSRSSEVGEVVVCPKRLYANDYESIKLVSKQAFGDIPVFIGGSLDNLKAKAMEANESVVAFGQNSGNEVSANSGGQLSMDWVLVKYTKKTGKLIAESFVGVEVQSIDITGNYRENWEAYRSFRSGVSVKTIPDSRHGMNWANVHKRLIPQIIRKGNIYKNCKKCRGFYFILPDLVYQKFEEVIGNIELQKRSSNETLCIMTYSLGQNVANGQTRSLKVDRSLCYNVKDIADSFASLVDKESVLQFENKVLSLLG